MVPNRNLLRLALAVLALSCVQQVPEVEAQAAAGETCLLQVKTFTGLSENLVRANDSSRVEATLPAGSKLLTSCADLAESRSDTVADVQLKVALGRFCTAGLGSLAEFRVDARFLKNYERAVGPDGWIDEAFVTYMGLKSDHDAVAAEEDLLAQSLQHFSCRPTVVTLFGNRVPNALDPDRFPKLILVHGQSTREVGRSFNFNKLTSMLFTKVKVGMVLDADQFSNRGVDAMFPRIAEETTAEYPYPIMPVHWMSRDPDSEDGYGVYRFYFKSEKVPARTMRWGHAHPTWTYHALPWLAKWTSFALAPQKTDCPEWLKQQGWVEDEDLLNLGLWADKATKQWCKFDISSPDLFRQFVSKEASTMMNPDSKWYPKGIALVYATAHDAKKPDVSTEWLSKLWDRPPQSLILYDGQWFKTGKELSDYDSQLRCIA